jgi:hypothetical protein
MNLGLILPEMNFRTQVVSPTAYVCLSPNIKKCGVSGMLYTCASTSMLPTVYLALQAHVYPTVKKIRNTQSGRPYFPPVSLLSLFPVSVSMPLPSVYLALITVYLPLLAHVFHVSFEPPR